MKPEEVPSNVTPITQDAEVIAKGKPGPKPKADVLDQARKSLQSHGGAVCESAINEMAKIVPGRQGATEALWWLAGQVRVGVTLADSAGQILPG